MSAIILAGGITIALTAIVLSDSEFVKAVKELVNLLVRTTTYTTEKIMQIMQFYI